MRKWIFLLIFVAPFTMSWGTEIETQKNEAISVITVSTSEATTNSDSSTAAATVESETPVLNSPKAESEIPLKIGEGAKAPIATASNERILLTFFVIMGILAVAYFYVRRYRTSNSINKSNKQIKIVSQHYLGPKKSLAIIHVAGESMLIGITENNISMIKSLSLIDDEIPSEVPNKFSDSLTSAGLNNENAPAGATAAGAIKFNAKITEKVEMIEADKNSEDVEDFSFSKIKDNVSKKLKNIRG